MSPTRPTGRGRAGPKKTKRPAPTQSRGKKGRPAGRPQTKVSAPPGADPRKTKRPAPAQSKGKKGHPAERPQVKISGPSGADPVREAAHEALMAFSRRASNAENLLSRFAFPDFNLRDRGFFRELLYGVLRWRGRLDTSYERFLNEPRERLSSAVREALRLGAYQIMFMDRVPDHGAVNASVHLAGRKKGKSARGLVNAVLRRVAREPLKPPKDLEDRLTIWESHPRWLVKRWIRALGAKAARARCEANNAEGPVVIRANSLLTDAASLAGRLKIEGVATSPGRADPDCLWVDASTGNRAVSFTKTSSFEAGAFIVQDEAASLAARFAGIRPGARALDICAAPGGKTAVISWMAGPEGMVTAADSVLARLGRLKSNCARIGAPVRIVVMDAGKPAFGDVFDSVFVDAPCSGTGVLRRHPDARWRLREEDFARHGRMQRAILEGSARAVRPGGSLTYAVCTNEPEETDEVASAMDGPGFVREPGADHLPPGARGFAGDDGALRILPEGGLGLDGFFAVRWRRTKEGT